jgi:hypothetical protein
MQWGVAEELTRPASFPSCGIKRSGSQLQHHQPSTHPKVSIFFQLQRHHQTEQVDTAEEVYMELRQVPLLVREGSTVPYTITHSPQVTRWY